MATIARAAGLRNSFVENNVTNRSNSNRGVAAQERKTKFLLCSIRVASLNLKSWAAEVDAIGIELNGGAISLDTACEWLSAMGLLHWLPTEHRARQ
jgi:hypothetical protein